MHAILRRAGIKGETMLSYAARIKKDTDGYLVTFPDFENVMTYGLTTEEALLNAEEALNGCLEYDFERNFKLPEPSRIVGKNVYQVPVARTSPLPSCSGRCVPTAPRWRSPGN